MVPPSPGACLPGHICAQARASYILARKHELASASLLARMCVASLLARMCVHASLRMLATASAHMR